MVWNPFLCTDVSRFSAPSKHHLLKRYISPALSSVSATCARLIRLHLFGAAERPAGFFLPWQYNTVKISYHRLTARGFSPKTSKASFWWDSYHLFSCFFFSSLSGTDCAFRFNCLLYCCPLQPDCLLPHLRRCFQWETLTPTGFNSRHLCGIFLIFSEMVSPLVEKYSSSASAELQVTGSLLYQVWNLCE